MHERHGLMASLPYGTGIAADEVRPPADQGRGFWQSEIVVRDGKDRRTTLPLSLRDALLAQLERARRLHAHDVAQGGGEVWLPDALARKSPNAAREPGWQYLFPAPRCSVDRVAARSGAIIWARRGAACSQGRVPRVGADQACQLLPHPAAFVRHAPDGGRSRYPHRAEAVGSQGRGHHADLHACAGRGASAVRSPLDGLNVGGG